MNLIIPQHLLEKILKVKEETGKSIASQILEAIDVYSKAREGDKEE